MFPIQPPCIHHDDALKIPTRTRTQFYLIVGSISYNVRIPHDLKIFDFDPIRSWNAHSPLIVGEDASAKHGSVKVVAEDPVLLVPVGHGVFEERDVYVVAESVVLFKIVEDKALPPV